MRSQGKQVQLQPRPPPKVETVEHTDSEEDESQPVSDDAGSKYTSGKINQRKNIMELVWSGIFSVDAPV